LWCIEFKSYFAFGWQKKPSPTLQSAQLDIFNKDEQNIKIQIEKKKRIFLQEKEKQNFIAVYI